MLLKHSMYTDMYVQYTHAITTTHTQAQAARVFLSSFLPYICFVYLCYSTLSHSLSSIFLFCPQGTVVRKYHRQREREVEANKSEGCKPGAATLGEKREHIV